MARPGQSISISVSGRLQLSQRLRLFMNSVTDSAVRASLKEMAKPIVKGVSAAAPKQAKILSKNIVSKVLKSKRTKALSLRIGARNKKFQVVRINRNKRVKLTASVKKKYAAGKIIGKREWANPARFSHLVALGTKHGVKPTDYLRRGLRNSEAAAMFAFQRSMEHQVKIAGMKVK
jgi:hypothetical protein